MTLQRLLRAIVLPALFLFAAQLSFAQEKVVTGRVMDSKDANGVPGVSVTVKGSRTGTQTSSDGTFRISVPANATTLVFSSVGYKAQEVDITGKTQVDVALELTNSQLGEVVVTGYGTARKSDVTGSVSKVTPKDFNKGVNQTVDQLLQGRVAGLVVSRAGNDPNGSPNIQLRGPGSLLGGGQPFYVIDGVPGASIDLVAPDDIASIDVLKDASAAAIYGTRAANGVIIVTTKRAKAGTGYVSYNGYGAVESIARRLEVLSADELRQFAADNNLQGLTDDGVSTDWQDEITQTGLAQNHNISFGGGTSNAKYNASVNYYGQRGVVMNSSIKRMVGRLGAEFTGLDGRLRLGFNVANSIIDNNYVNLQGEFNNAYFQAVRFLPTLNVKNEDGSWRQTPGVYNSYNPVAMLEQYQDKRKGNTFLGSVKAGLDLTSWLSYDIILSMQRDNSNGIQFLQTGAAQQDRFDWQGRRYNNNSLSRILENFFTFNKTFDVHKTKLLVGYSWQEDQFDGFGANMRNLFDATGANNLGLSLLVPDGFNGVEPSYKNSRRLISFYGRFEYGWGDRLNLTATLRRDGSSVFGANNKWALFPSVAVAYKLINEGFMKNQNVFSNLVLRVGYGSSGEQNIGVNQSLLRYAGNPTQTFYYNGDFIGAFNIVQNPNPDLKWQTTNMLNIGIDFGFMSNRLTGTLELYNKNSNDLLFNYTVPSPPFQFDQLIDNQGSVNNKGVELTVNYNVIRQKNFTWSTSIVGAYNKNEITSISNGRFGDETIRYLGGIGGQGLSNENVFVAEVGQPVGTFFLYDFVGQDRFGNQYYRGADGKTKLASELSGRVDQFRFVGALPKVTFGWNNNFTFGDFDLAFFFRGAAGNKIMNATGLNLDRAFSVTSYNILKSVAENPSFEQPRPSTKYLEDASFVRLDNATLGYNIPFTNKYVKSMRVYTTVQNVFTITGYSGIDPELNLSGLTPGLDFGIYPRTRTFTLGFNVNF